jgi:hypothetical protein
VKLETLRLVPRLGYRNVARVALHRLKKAAGWYALRHPVAAPSGATVDPPFAPRIARAAPIPAAAARRLRSQADELVEGRFAAFGGPPVAVGSPPDWFRSVLTGRSVDAPPTHWSRIDDFASGAGDIKGVWELSRFAWAPALAAAAADSGEPAYLDTLNAWTLDWLRRNPRNRGPHWMCGQETALRMLHLLAAARHLGQHRTPTPTLVRTVAEHCGRIHATLPYAVAQANNHAISEAAGLYIGGAWLGSVLDAKDVRVRLARGWERTGRRRLVAGVRRLVAPDGSFPQQSLNYHRMVVDLLAAVEDWRATLGRPAFPRGYAERARSAVRWLDAFTDPVSGDAPNFGPNDGAQVLGSAGGRFRDYGGAVERARSAFPGTPPAAGSELVPRGGYARLAEPGAGRSWAMVRIPLAAFRPGDSDPLHVDLWDRGRNLLRDGGTFSYHPEFAAVRAELAGPAGHNTAQFDGRDPMPVVGPFLRRSRIRSVDVGRVEVTAGAVRWSGCYRDDAGAEHGREIAVGSRRWEVTDRLSGYRDRAVLRWRLHPGSWTLSGRRCSGPFGTIAVDADAPLRRVELVEGRESRRYGEHTPLPVLEVEVEAHRRPVTVVTRLTLPPDDA